MATKSAKHARPAKKATKPAKSAPSKGVVAPPPMPPWMMPKK